MVLSNSQKKEVYNEIMKMYAFADDIIKSVDTNSTINRDKKIKMAERFLEAYKESTETVLDKFIKSVKTNGSLDKRDLLKAERAIRNVYIVAWDIIQEVNSNNNN
jgi:NurA-like 5'-3' nuclease